MRSPATPVYRSCLRSLLAAGVALALAGPTPALAQAEAPAAAAQAVDFHIPAQPMDTALTRLADRGGVRILFASDEVAGLQGRGVEGRYTAEQALSRLLAGTGLTWHWREPGIVVVGKVVPGRPPGADGVIVTDSLNVAGQGADDATGARRDTRGYDDVYDLDSSTAYVGRIEVERYKGATPSDLVNGVPGVFSGDARNSGALDVNIRGIQGPGRVPVTIDGTEQALTVWRGYNGITNRNYIDPNLIGGIQIVKGPSLVRDVSTGVGGAVVIKTLDADDVVEPGESFGGEFKLEGSSNAVAPRLPTLLTGQDYRDVPGFPDPPSSAYNDPTLRVDLKSRGGGYNVFDGEDHAYRLALGWKSDQLDLFGAYAYRERGNYFSGEKDAGYYAQRIAEPAIEDYITTLANYFEPGNEVPNTSSQMESWLFKATWRPNDDQALQFGYRDSLSHYGEIIPSRIEGSDDRGRIQWPLSRVDAKSYNLEYRLQPEDHRWLDLRANLWRTDTLSDTYTAGGFPNYAQGDPLYGYDPVIIDTALANASNARNGVTLSNRFRLADALDLTVGGSFRHEKLRSGDEWIGEAAGWRMFPRSGRREEWDANFNFEWRPTEYLTLNAGMRYSSYWAFDDFLAAHEGEFAYGFSGQQATYYTRSPEEVQSYHDGLYSQYQIFVDLGIFTPEQVDQIVRQAVDSWPGQTHTVPWERAEDGKYYRTGNICVNGFMETVEHLVSPYINGQTCDVTSTSDLTHTGILTAEKRRDRGWAPSLSATVRFSDYSRAYFRYDETLRYPSMFESTLGFSANSFNPFYSLKPEHAHNWEVAYVHDLSGLLAADGLADVKLSYYVHKTRDVIDRNSQFFFSQLDKQSIEGVELNARYDGARFFTDLAVSRTLKNEVCDESTAIALDPDFGAVPNCVQDGFVTSYLLTQAIPRFSAKWSLGGRFWDGKLEAGGRVTYYDRHRNPDLDRYREYKQEVQSIGFFNVPFSWDEVLTLDAYASYLISDGLRMELAGTNLSDRYFTDPATRSTMPAPGRTLKLSLTARF
ncbi:TonB-dependent receptor domain-containing protein [Luteimonas sp. R10]|uniref:TonB-dependent receptor n=1 Tax=Luteimonas sp. R10 TaxID=3108176 RepID=UPI00308CB0CD|nr:TonB-dependent receptor [Luteimonas sp. R10]